MAASPTEFRGLVAGSALNDRCCVYAMLEAAKRIDLGVAVHVAGVVPRLGDRRSRLRW